MSSFVPDMDQWVNTHFVDVPALISAEIGSLAGKSVLDVGCGETLISLGMLATGATSVTALDIKPVESVVQGAVARVEAAGFPVSQHVSKLKPVQYDGVNMPFADSSFDVVISWGVMEHVADVPGVLKEMRRVMKPNGVGYVKVFPWFHSFFGSHLSDFTPEPFSHLKFSKPKMREIVEGNAHKNTQLGEHFVLTHMWDEYETLNGYSANMFYRAVKAAGFSSDVWKLISYQHDLSDAPPGVDLSDLMVSGTETILRK